MDCKAFLKNNDLLLEVYDTDKKTLEEYARACNVNDPSILSFYNNRLGEKVYTLYIPKITEPVYLQLCEIAQGVKPEFQTLQIEAAGELEKLNQTKKSSKIKVHTPHKHTSDSRLFKSAPKENQKPEASEHASRPSKK